MISFAPFADGSVHNVYLPAGRWVLPIIRSRLVVIWVAAFAPVRHTRSQGTTLPKIVRPRRNGRLYAISMFAAPTVARTVSGGEACAWSPPDAARVVHACCKRSKSRLFTRRVTVPTVVPAVASI